MAFSRLTFPPLEINELASLSNSCCLFCNWSGGITPLYSTKGLPQSKSYKFYPIVPNQIFKNCLDLKYVSKREIWSRRTEEIMNQKNELTKTKCHRKLRYETKLSIIIESSSINHSLCHNISFELKYLEVGGKL